jgi:hypothetical protein
MSRLWVKVIKRQRIVEHDALVCEWQNIKPALTALCKRFDIPAPIWLNKHEAEMNDFRRTAFARDHFIEDVPFDRLELEYLADDSVRRKSDDPRNQF